MARLTFISDVADRELDAIRRTVEVFERVASAEQAAVALREHAARGTVAETLDLIGHSRAHGFVALGTWLLDDSPPTAATFSQDLRPALDAIGIREIRLLGCSSGTSTRGLAALRRISLAARREVFGTRRYISKNDYARGGFISEDTLVGVAGPRGARADRVGFLLGAATLVPLSAIDLSVGPKLTADHPILPVNEDVAARLLRCIDETRSWVLPGLLAEPSPIVLWSQDNTIHRLEVLLDRQVVRGYGVYPDDDHGRLFRVRDPEALSNQLDELIRPRSEIPARDT